MSQRRVLIIVQNLPVPLDRRVWLECQALVAAGYAVSVICPMGPGDSRFQELKGVRIHKYPPPPPAEGAAGFFFEFLYCWLRTAALALRILCRDGFDVVQACNPPDTYFLLGALFKLMGKKFVFDHHDLCPEIYTARFRRDSGLLLRALRLLERATFATADQVISTNESYRDIALGRGGHNPNSVTVVRSGPDLDRLRRRRKRPELKDGKPFLCCYLGVMGPQDGVDTLLKAADVIVHDMGRVDFHFALLGFGDCLEDLRRESQMLGLGPWVTFAGRADDDMICDYLSTADLGLSPDPKSAFNDRSTMNKTLEYMVFGLPVVAFDLAETRVSVADAGVYVESEDVAAYAKAIVSLADDPERRELMGVVGRARVEHRLAWCHQAPRYVGVYGRLFETVR